MGPDYKRARACHRTSCRHATIALRSRALSMIDRLDRTLLAVNRGVVIAILAAMATMVFANVALRFSTDASILWVEEVSRYLMIWLTFLGGGLVLRYGGHIGIETLQEALPGQAAVIRGAITILLGGFFVCMIVLGGRYVWLAWDQTTPVLGIPIG